MTYHRESSCEKADGVTDILTEWESIEYLSDCTGSVVVCSRQTGISPTAVAGTSGPVQCHCHTYRVTELFYRTRSEILSTVGNCLTRNDARINLFILKSVCF